MTEEVQGQMADYALERKELERAQRIEHVAMPDVDVHRSGINYLELLCPSSDMLFHIFALPEDTRPFGPPDGIPRLRRALEFTKERARLPVEDQWYEAVWETDGLPREVHDILRRIEDDVDTWLRAGGMPDEKLTSAELLSWLGKRMFKVKGRSGSSFMQRLHLCERMRQDPLVRILAEVGANIGFPPDTPGPDISYFDNIPQIKRGCWVVRMFNLADRVHDYSAVANALLLGFDA